MDAIQNEKPVSMGEWMLTLLLTAIPLVGLIMLLIWAFGGGAAPSKSNWAKATLIWAVIAIAVYIGIFVLVLGGAAIAAANS